MLTEELGRQNCFGSFLAEVRARKVVRQEHRKRRRLQTSLGLALHSETLFASIAPAPDYAFMSRLEQAGPRDEHNLTLNTKIK